MKAKDAFDFISHFTTPTLLLKRRVHFHGKRGRETLAEHIVQLLYFAEFFVRTLHLSYNLNLIREYILSHDMSEPATPYAKRNGFDICRFCVSAEVTRRKKKLESQALRLQKKQFPALAPLVSSAEKYDEQNDTESRFVKAIDALVPTLNVILDHGRTHHVDSITLHAWRTDREWRIKLDPHVKVFYEEEILPKLLACEEELFAKQKQQELDFAGTP